MHKLLSTLTIIFGGFILWIIYMANTGQYTPFFGWVRSIPYGDKIGHVLIFGLLTLGGNIMSRFKTVRLAKIHIYLGTLIIASFAFFEELSQHFMANRRLDMGDLLADVIGISLFTFISWLVSKKYRPRN